MNSKKMTKKAKGGMAKKPKGYSSGGMAQKRDSNVSAKAVKPSECKAGASYKG